MPPSSSPQPPVQPWKVADARANKTGQCQTVYWVKPALSTSSLRSLPASAQHALPPPSVRHYAPTATYRGAWLRNERHGYGTLSTPGWVYEGDFKAGRQCGQGQLFLKAGEGSWRAYSGEWKDGRRDGVGVYHYRDGSRYEGQWQAGLRHGNGTLFFPSGDTYTGGWDRGQQSGFGSLVKAGGDVYEGMYVRGRREGQGMYYYREKDKMFDGEWVDDQPISGVILAAREFFQQQRQQQAEVTAAEGQDSAMGLRPSTEGGRFSLSRPTTAAMLEVSRMVMAADEAEQIPPLELIAPDAILAQQLTLIANNRAPIRALTALPPLPSLYPPATLTLLRSLFDDQLARNAKQHLHPAPTSLIHSGQLKQLIEAKWFHEGRRIRPSKPAAAEVNAALHQLGQPTAPLDGDGLGSGVGWEGAVFAVWLVEQQRRVDEVAGREERDRQVEELAVRLSGRKETASPAKAEEQKEQLTGATVVAGDGGAVAVEDASDSAEGAVEDVPAAEASEPALFDATTVNAAASQ